MWNYGQDGNEVIKTNVAGGCMQPGVLHAASFWRPRMVRPFVCVSQLINHVHGAARPVRATL